MRRWSFILLAPLTIACAAVLGLEEAELDDSEGDGGKSGSAGAVECKPNSGDACFDDCVQDECCGAYQNCFGNKACQDFLNCRNACNADTDCEDECADEYPDGWSRTNALAFCVVGCECQDGTGGRGGVIPNPMGGASGGGRPGSGGSGTGGQGNTPRSCDPEVDSFTCATASAIRYCDGDTFQTAPCRTFCMSKGFGPGGNSCGVDGCDCGEPVNAACLTGTVALCACNAEFGEPCTPAQEVGLYVYCHQEETTISSVVLCAADEADAGSTCAEIASYCGL